jgi:hypothetical protein
MATQKKKYVTFAVDRIEGDRVILQRDDDGSVVERPLASMRGARESMIYRVPMSAGGLNWSGAMADRMATASRMQSARQQRKGLAERMYPDMR